MIKVTVTGSECTGKTTLAKALAAHYSAGLVHEYAREFVRKVGRAPVEADVEAIARGQIAAEDEMLRHQPGLLILDTDLLSTWVYSRHYYGRAPAWIDKGVEDRSADLYLLCSIDIPWIADGLQRDRPEARPEMHELFRHELLLRGLRFVEIVGRGGARREAALSAVDDLLAAS